MRELSQGAEDNPEQRWQVELKSQKPRLRAWQSGWGKGPAGGRSRFIDAAKSPGEIKVKGSSLAKEEAHPLFINQRGWGKAERCWRRETTPQGPGPNSEYLNLVLENMITGELRAGG